MTHPTRKAWAENPLGEVCDVLDRFRKPITKADRVAGPYPYYGATGLLDHVAGYIFDEPLVLIGEDGAKWGAGDNSAFSISGRTWVNNHAHVLRPHRDLVLDEWLIYYLNATDLSDFISGMTVPKLNQARMREIPIPLPPIEEQRRMVAVLDEAFEGLARARTNAEANLKDATELFGERSAALFHLLSVKRETETYRVEDLAAAERGAIRTGPFGSQLLHSEFVDEGIAVLGIDNAVANEFRWDKRRFITHAKYQELRRYTVQPGDVIITIMGTCGRCAVIPDDIPAAINTKHLCCITLDQKKCLPDFLHAYFLHSPKARSYLEGEASGSVMDGLNMGIIKALPVDLPSLERQQELVGHLRELREATTDLAARYSAKINDIGELRQTLLHKAFSGELT